MSQGQHIYINKSLLILKMSRLWMHPCKMDRMEGVQFPLRERVKTEETKHPFQLAMTACRQFSEECVQQTATCKPALQHRGRWFTFQEQLTACQISHLLQGIWMNKHNPCAWAKIILPLEYHVRSVLPCPSYRVLPLCLLGESQSRPLYQTGNTLGRDDGLFPGLSQLGQCGQSTSELPHHECTFLHEYHWGPEGTRWEKKKKIPHKMQMFLQKHWILLSYYNVLNLIYNSLKCFLLSVVDSNVQTWTKQSLLLATVAGKLIIT